MANFCPHCGGSTRPGATFCGVCGRPLQPSATPAGPPFFTIQEPGKAVYSYPITKPLLTLGREGGNDLVINQAVVSRRHARLEQQGAAYWISDLGSTNGTWVNGRRLTQSQALQANDIIRIGDEQGNSVSFTFSQGQLGPAAKNTIQLDGQQLGQLAAYTIGRLADNQVQLDHPLVSKRHAQVRQTTQGPVIQDLNSSNGTFLNGQRLSGEQLLNNGDVILIGPFKLVYAAGGPTVIRPDGNYRLDAIALRREVSVGAATKKIILNNVSLSIYPREFIALVGGSGAGKSTLMQALSGFTPAGSGQVLINGDDLYANFDAYRTILGYVPQDDIIHGQLTVQQALTYAAQLRLPDASPNEIERRIGDVLNQVEMTDHLDKQINRLSGGQRKRVSIAVELLAEPGLFFLDEPTSGLDPGLEKKMMFTLRRLADGGRTIILVTHATANITQCTHVAFMADGYLAFFGPPQEALAFFGANDFSDIYTRLSQPIDPMHNPLPAEWQLYYQQLQGQYKELSGGAVWAACFQQSAYYQRYVSGRIQTPPNASAQLARRQAPAGPNISPFKQLAILTHRYFNLVRRDTFSLFVLLAVMPIIGLLLLLIAKPHYLTGLPKGEIGQTVQEKIDQAIENQDPSDDKEQFLGNYVVGGDAQLVVFMMGLAANLLGVFAASYEIIKENSIYRRERMINLQVLPYLLSKVVVLAFFAAAQCLLLLLVIRLRVDYPPEGIFLPVWLELYITLFLATLASIAQGLLISAAVRNQDTVIYVILVVIFVQIMFGGAIFKMESLSKGLSYFTTTRWTLEAMGSAVDLNSLNEIGVSCLAFEDEEMERLFPNSEEPCEDGQMRQGAEFEFYVNFGHSAGVLFSRWLVLLAFTALFGGLTYRLQSQKDVL